MIGRTPVSSAVPPVRTTPPYNSFLMSTSHLAIVSSTMPVMRECNIQEPSAGCHHMAERLCMRRAPSRSMKVRWEARCTCWGAHSGRLTGRCRRMSSPSQGPCMTTRGSAGHKCTHVFCTQHVTDANSTLPVQVKIMMWDSERHTVQIKRMVPRFVDKV